MINFLLFLNLSGFAQTIHLDPVVISDQTAISESTSVRSVEWPTQVLKPEAPLLTPQLDSSLNFLNGVQARSQGSPSISIRGSGQSGRTLVLFKDIPLNFATGFGAPGIFLAKELVSDVQVIKGPSSLFYGSQALGGSLNFQSTVYRETQLTLSFSDTDESFLPWKHGGVAHNSFHIASPLIQKKSSHWQASYFNESDDGQFPYRLNGQSGVRENNSQNLGRIVLEGFESGANWLLNTTAVLGREIRQSPGPINFPFATREESEGLLLSAAPQYFITESLSWKSQLTYLQMNSQFTDSTGDTFSEPQSLILQNELSQSWGRQFHLQLFLDGFKHSMRSSFLSQNRNQDYFELGPFFNMRPSGESPWLLKLGGRFLSLNQQFLSTVALHYQWYFVETWVSFAEGFRNPSLNDLFAQTPFFVGNPDLSPEKSRQWEWGMRGQRQHSFGKITFDTRIFHTQYTNFLESFETQPGVYSRQNIGAGISQGAELQLGFDKPTWGVQSHYNYLNTSTKDLGIPFRLSPKQQWGLTSRYKISQKLEFSVQFMKWSETFDIANNQATRLPDWSQWNLLGNFKLSEKMGLQAGVVNAFNEQKALSLNYPEPGRRYWLQIRYQL